MRNNRLNRTVFRNKMQQPGTAQRVSSFTATASAARHLALVTFDCTSGILSHIEASGHTAAREGSSVARYNFNAIEMATDSPPTMLLLTALIENVVADAECRKSSFDVSGIFQTAFHLATLSCRRGNFNVFVFGHIPNARRAVRSFEFNNVADGLV